MEVRVLFGAPFESLAFAGLSSFSFQSVEAQRVHAVPRLLGPGLGGLPADKDGSSSWARCARPGCERTWAAGDGVALPVKLGGVAPHHARAAAAIARRVGVEDARDPASRHPRPPPGGRAAQPAARGRRAAVAAARQVLPRGLRERAVGRPAAEEPKGEAITVNRPLSEVRGPEVEYLRGLAREFRSGDPALADLGRQMREVPDP